MSLIEKAIYTVINGKRTVTKPIFLKDFQEENEQLKDLIELSSKVSSDKKDFIERDIAFLKQGLDGEKNVYFELKNSFIPMLCLHDIRLEYNDYVAQFDFIIITNKFIFVLETKKLNGDIEITKDGDFIRTIRTNSGKFIKKEGMYSPISQNERHVNILKEILINEGLIKTYPIKAAVVIANPKSIINKTKCPKYIQNNIYKYDQLVNLLKREVNNKNNDKDILEKYMYAIANFLIKNNKPITFDYLAKYSLNQDDFKDVKKSSINVEQITDDNKLTNSHEFSQTYELLRKYRWNKSKEEDIKPYMIFNNNELNSLIEKKPKTKEELLKIKGFGDKKVQKYGEDILSILNSEK